MKVNDATRAQIDASNPLASTWLTANAGSGKTKVLTDRVARLLLLGVDPQSILCLTYTKAAAAEMQNRLFKRLGEWAMLPGPELKQALAIAGINDIHDLGTARTLFARAIETPGGLKIQTIHSFAAALLRRFPLEAGISPDFRELDDTGADALRRDIVDDLALRSPSLIADIARHQSGDDLDGLAQTIASKRNTFPITPNRAKTAKILGIETDLTHQALLDALIGSDGHKTIDALRAALKDSTTNDQKALTKIEAIDPLTLSVSDQITLEGVFLFGEKAAVPYGAKSGKFPTKAARDAMGGSASALDAMMERAAALREQRLALDALDQTMALQNFAAAFLPAYAKAKAVRGVLDFDDLIAGADQLLSNRAVANWVLYKIDGDIEHILVDEAQDTSPAQWRLIEKLTQEMTSGEGAETDVPRSIFVVGDRKQSIYSFQGADPREMERMAGHYQERFAGNRALARRELLFSFRSSSAILSVVDAAFQSLAGQGVGDHVEHSAFHGDLPGRVDLWPIEEPSEKPADPAWYDPRNITQPSDPTARLSKKIAAEVVNWLESETIPAENGKSRPVQANDILVLFQKRNALFHQTIRACKEAGLEVAGADRIKLQDEIAVQDIISVLSFLALPEDDLALAEALRSPLFGWSEDNLFRLAHGRGEAFLWQELRAKADAHPETLEILQDLRDQADFLRPYEIIDRLLTRHAGRARLLSRLGDEAEEGIDALLTQAMLYEEREPPSLTGFVAWYAGSEIDIKRQAGSAQAGLRVMTVHGAKGLESPIVILPDTLVERTRQDTLLIGPGDQPILPVDKASRPAIAGKAAEARANAIEEERQRLLYVAMTRAEVWLVVAGAGKPPTKGNTWYEIAQNGIEAAGPTSIQTTVDGTQFQRFEAGRWDRPVRDSTSQEDTEIAVPSWAMQERAAPEKTLPISPSDLGGAKALAGEAGLDEESALAFGTALHMLLEHLPRIDQRARQTAAQNLVSGFEPDIGHLSIAEAMALLNAPHLSDIFAPDTLAEVDIAAKPSILGGNLMSGSIDRLIVTDTTVTAIDFKSNRVVPKQEGDVPSGILRQMGAYAAALSQVYPNHDIQTAILWTATGELMSLPHDIVRDALLEAAIS